MWSMKKKYILKLSFTSEKSFFLLYIYSGKETYLQNKKVVEYASS